MPAKILKVSGKTKADLQKNYASTVKKASKQGLIYVKEGYDDKKIKRIKGGYELNITVHS